MKLYHLASLLMAAQVMSSPMPQGWGAPPAGWSPAPVAVPDEGIVVAAAETLMGTNISLTNTMGDIIFTTANDALGDAAIGVATNLIPHTNLGIYAGTVEIDNAAIADAGPTIFTYSNGADTNVINGTSLYHGSMYAVPHASSGSTVANVVATSWVQASDGVGVANTGSVGSGWKQDEGVKQN